MKIVCSLSTYNSVDIMFRNTFLMQTAMKATLPGSLKTRNENSAVAVTVEVGEGALTPQAEVDQSWREK